MRATTQQAPGSADTHEKLQRKRLAFKKLGERRTNAILERIRILGNLANRSAYEYSDDDLKKIFSIIEQELRITRAKFQATEKREFRLD